MEPQDTQQPQPLQTPPPIPPKPQVKNSLVLIMSILLIVTVGIAGLFYFQIQKLSKELSKYQTQSSPTPTATPDSTANWKTFTSTKFGFSFKYPPELTYIYDQSDQYVEKGISNAMILIQNFDGAKPRTETDNDFQMVIYIANKSGQFNLEASQGEQTKTAINGVEAIKTFTTQKWVLVPTVFFQSSPNKVAVQLSSPKSTNKNWFDQTLSTFKFTEGSQTGGTQTKTNCVSPRPEACTLECIANPPYICGSDGKNYCSTCQACSNKDVAWYEITNSPCSGGTPL